MNQYKSVDTHPATVGTRTTIIGILANALLAGIKGLAGILGNSYALIADAVESGTDVFSSLVVLGGLRLSKVPPDKDHPYGHGKAEPLAAAVVSLGLIVAALSIAIQSIREIKTPHHAPASFTLLVLVVAVVTKEILFRFVFKTGLSLGSTVVKTDAWHHRSDALTSLAAFVGISIALLGGPGYESADDWAALFASGVIVFNGIRLLRPAILEAMDTAPSGEVTKQILQTAGQVPGVIGLDKCFVRKMGFDYYVDLHVIVDANLPVRKAHKIGHDVKDQLRRQYSKIRDVLVHIEPDQK
ncbi:MAG: cobalt-zinc-cadmium resistance protein [candidate division Zixibacteria bacterium RBG_16_40_9]|nr:MAG: cobalt-zinc-cadmium resistance protein [candidate division Zixibacteria bacterium RBG_16_40_9]